MFISLLFAILGMLSNSNADQASQVANEATTQAIFDTESVQKLAKSDNAVWVEVTEEEAVQNAKENGLALRRREKDDPQFGRPWFILKTGFGLPNLINMHFEVFVSDRISLEIGGGMGLLPTMYEGNIRWNPAATCWNCDGKNSLALGFGIDNLFGKDGKALAVLVTASLDVKYVHRFSQHFGLVIGSHAGLGITTEFGSDRDWTHIEPGLNLTLLQSGVEF